ncbi:MAG: RNB domain-containing ribonuclease [Cyanobacteria bacterium J06621_11]
MSITTSSQSPKTSHEAWSQAITQAEALPLAGKLWERPQVQGFTIDGPTSKDLDDAIYFEATPTGGIASIHIADVSELVTIGTPLDKVALARTQTRYLSHGNIPMLPPALSEDKLSLLEGQPRPTLTVQISLNEQAEIQTTEIFESWLISAKRFSYEQADRVCQSPTHPFHEQLQLCQAWAERLNQERRNQGAIGGLFNSSGFWTDENGAVMKSEGHLFHAQMIIQEFMILANRAVAQWFANRDVLALYRNHTARTIAPEREQIMQALLTTGSMDLIRQKLQNWLNKAEYNPTLVGHFALNLTAYCHFTSPIRRLADLLNHRIIKALLHQQPHPYRKVELEQLGTYIATVTEQAEAATKAFYKQRHQRTYQKQLQAEDATASLVALSDKEFSHIVKHAAKAHNFEPIRAAAIQRLSAETLPIQSLALLLIHSGDLSLQQPILTALRQKPEDATSVLVLAVDQTPSWEQLEYVEASQDSPPFLFWVEVLIAGVVRTTSAPAQNQRKQIARHLACLSWLEAFVANQLVTPAERPSQERPSPEQPIAAPAETMLTEPSPVAAPAVPSILSESWEGEQNFVGILQELFQSQGWALPAYQFTEAGAGFLCTCSVFVEEEAFQGSGTTSQKKKAKQLAAKDTLIQLQRWFQHGERIESDKSERQPTQVSPAALPPILFTQLDDGENFIGLLQQLCQTLNWELPEYAFSGETPKFVCTCMVRAGEERFKGRAMSAKKKSAKYYAAKVALLNLQQHFQNASETAGDANPGDLTSIS